MPIIFKQFHKIETEGTLSNSFYEDTSYQTVWGIIKAVLRENCIAPSASKKELEWSYSSSLTAHLKALEQKESNTPKRSRWQKIITAEINQVETKRPIQRINRTRSWFFEKINNGDKSLVNLSRGHRDSKQIKIWNEKGDTTTETEEILKNQQIPLQKPILNTTGKYGWNGQFSRHIPGTKVKSGSDKPSKQFHSL